MARTGSKEASGKPGKPGKQEGGSPPEKKKKPRKKGAFGPFMSRLFLLLFILGLLTLLALRLFSDLFGPRILRFEIFTTETQLVADGLLVGMQGLDELQVLNYVSKVVFPYDYLDEQADLQLLSRAMAASRQGLPLEGRLGPADLRSFEAYNLARMTGFDPASPGSPFLVLTLVYEFGYRIGSDQTPVELSGDEENAEILIREPGLLRVRIEDPRRGRYPYPDTPLSAENLKRVSDFVLARAEEMDGLDEVRRKAGEEARKFFQGSAQALGIENFVLRSSP